MRADISAAFIVFASVSLAPPLLGARAETVAFSLAFLLISLGAVRARVSSRRAPERRVVWLAFGAAAAAGALGALALLVADLADARASLAYGLGGLPALGIAAGALGLARRALPVGGLDRAVDALLPALAAAGVAGWFVVRPGLEHGNLLLVAIFVVGLASLACVAVATAAWEGALRRVAGATLAGIAFLLVGHGVVAASADAASVAGSWHTGVAWALAGIALVTAAYHEDGSPALSARPEAGEPRGWISALVLPLGAVLLAPAVILALHLAGALTAPAAGYHAVLFFILLVLALGRQAHLLAENQRAVRRERGLSEQIMRRNEDLEALTTLAMTMTETLDETPIVERGLGVLHFAARSSSAALHMTTDGGEPQLRVTAGDWNEERPWEPGPLEARARRGGRDLVRLPLAARGTALGTVTLVRSAEPPFEDEEVGLLRILANQLAIAVQNARDYHDKLEQAVRDPLTGLYNRRYFFEALRTEVKRCVRYGSHASLVIFDVDDFKAINDSLGHAGGDTALRAIAEIALGLTREVDSFARIGGEEFALLLPETQQLDALLVAERIRTAVADADILPGRRVTLSGGLSSCPLDADVEGELERRADAALYWAKRSGKNICALAGEATAREAGDETSEDILSHLGALAAAVGAGRRESSERVAGCAVAIAHELGLAAEHIVALRRAALFHDIGTVAVEASILEKPGALDDAELGSIRLHPMVGATMLAHAGLTREAAWVRSHHEQVDGKGYPDGIAGDMIPLESRIILVAEAFESISSGRPYREGAGTEAALAELDRCAGAQFDPVVVEALARVAERRDPAVATLRGSA